MKFIRFFAPAFLCFSAISGLDVHAQLPTRTSATYDDWTVSCTLVGSEKSCEIAQTQAIQGQNSPIQIMIGRVAKNDPFRIVFQVTSNVWLPDGVKLVSSEKEALVVAPFRWCLPLRCLADIELSDSVLSKLGGSTNLQLVWKNVSQSEVALPVTLNGFFPAFAAMKAQMTPTSSGRGESKRFDGQWSTDAECQAVPPNVSKASWKTTSKIENGKLFAKFGDEGKPGSGKFEGEINGDRIELLASGLSGDRKYSSGNVPENTPFTWKATGSFSDLHGTATRTEGRFCVVNFSKIN
ncbi:invasion associated locus B family protein [Bradyrhizobium guangdongense]